MAEEEKEMQPQEAEAKSAAPEEVVMEKVSDDEFASILSDTFGDFSRLAALLPSFKTADGDLVRGVEWLDPKKDFQRKEFLNKKNYATQRKLLAERLKLWVNSLSASDNLDDIRKTINEKSAKLEENLEKNDPFLSVSLSASAKAGSSSTVMPLTLTTPSRISSSHFRLEATPAAANIFCNLCFAISTVYK